MNSDQTNQLKTALVWAARKTLWEGDTWGKELTIKDSAVWFMRSNRMILLSVLEAREYQKGIRALLQWEPLTSHYSKKNLIASWQNLLVNLAYDHEEQPSFSDLNDKIEQWLEELLSAEEQDFTYYVVIDQLKAEEPKRIGRVFFSPLDETLDGEIRGRAIHSLDNNQYYAGKPEVISSIKKDWQDSLKDFSIDAGNTIARVTITTRDNDRGRELALEAIEESLHLIRFLRMLQSGDLPYPIGIQGTVGQGLRVVPTFSGKGWNLHEERVAFPLNLQRLSWTQRGFTELEAILQKTPEARSELENKMIGSLIWLGQSVDEPEEKMRLLKLWISMEMLLTARGEAGTTVAERMAFLLEESFQGRREVDKIANEIRKLRNALVHTGKAKDEAEIERYLPYAVALAANALIRVAELSQEHGWSQFSELKAHLEELKYS